MEGGARREGGMKREDQGGRRKGASGMEYGVVVGLIAVVAVAATATVGGKVKEIFGGTTNAVQLGMNGQLAPGANLSLSGGVTAPVAPTINTGSLPGGTTGIAYSQPLSATAQNNDPVAWSLASGALPTGVSLSGASLAGTPAATGAFSFTLAATDTMNTLSATQPYSVSISAGAPAIATGSLPAATYAVGWSQTLSATTTPPSNGVAWSVAAGSTLPAWLSLNGTTGVLSGTPNSMATGSFTLTATDKVSAQAASMPYSVSVAGTAPVVTTSTLPNSVWGTAYSQTLAATTTPGADGTNWALTGGTLPAGLSVTTSTGAIAGVPASSGTYTPTFTASDKVTGATASRTFTLIGTANPPTITTASLPAASTTGAYSQTLAATTAPAGDAVSWVLVSSTLPSGLTLNGSTGAISGTPTATGSFPITVQAIDTVTGQTAQTSYTLASTNAVAINATVSASANNLDFRTLLINAGWDGTTKVNGTVTINSGVWVGSSSHSNPALTISGSFPTGSTLVLVNNGHVSGAGGISAYAPSQVTDGGTAIKATVAVSIQNNGYVWGGGGGGGYGWGPNGNWTSGGGGGGTAPGYLYNSPGQASAFGTQSRGATARVHNANGAAGATPGTGGVGGPGGDGACGTIPPIPPWWSTSMPYGGGGGGGAPGFAGGAGGCGGGPGGLGGYYAEGGGYISWTAAGTRLGRTI